MLFGFNMPGELPLMSNHVSWLQKNTQEVSFASLQARFDELGDFVVASMTYLFCNLMA
jgi:hypothetical protein